MARKRMVDPGIWQSEQIASLTRDQRLLFIGMFSNADDEGRLKGSGRFLKMAIFPGDEDITSEDIRKWRDAIAGTVDGKGEAPIRVYTSNDMEYIELSAWSRWQKIEKPYASVLPSNSDHSGNVPQPSAERSPTILREEKRREEKKENLSFVASAPPVPSPVQEIWAYYLEHIQPKARSCPTEKIKTRLKEGWSADDLRTAMDRFQASYWWMLKCAGKGGPWFFESKFQIDKFLLIEPQTKAEYEAEEARRNGKPSTNGYSNHGEREVREPALFVAPGRAL